MDWEIIKSVMKPNHTHYFDGSKIYISINEDGRLESPVIDLANHPDVSVDDIRAHEINVVDVSTGKMR